MPIRTCEVCGGQFTQGRGRPARRCPEHQRYGGQHQTIRAAGIDAAFGTPCTRCGKPLMLGQEVHLDHRDSGPGYRGFSHASCNMRAGAVKGNKMRARAPIGAQVNGQQVPPRRPVTCQFHDPPVSSCPHSRDW